MREKTAREAVFVAEGCRGVGVAVHVGAEVFGARCRCGDDCAVVCRVLADGVVGNVSSRVKFAIAVASLLVLIVCVLVGALVFPRTDVKTRVVHVVDSRPLIRDNSATPAEVRANFAGKPAQVEAEGSGITCSFYGSPQSAIEGNGPVWVIRLCTRGIAS